MNIRNIIPPISWKSLEMVEDVDGDGCLMINTREDLKHVRSSDFAGFKGEEG